MATQGAIVIDDSGAMRMVLGGILRRLGYAPVLEAGQGDQALALLQGAELPLLALVDWNMPVMNGLEFIVAVRADDRFNAMRLMVITSETELGQMANALDAGADEYLMKPFSEESLVSKLVMLGLPVSADS
jgi:two-component system chemotaxis response regulator CheY